MRRHNINRLAFGLFVLLVVINFTFAERINIRLLKGSGGKGLPAEGAVLHLTKVSYADLNRIGNTIDWSSARQIELIQDFLVEHFDLQDVEDLFSISLKWDGTKSKLRDRIVDPRRGVLFPIELDIIHVGPNSYEIQIIIAQAGEQLESGQTISRNDLKRLLRGSRSPNQHKIIINDKLTIEKSELSISVVTSGESTYFLALRVDPDSVPEKQSIAAKPKKEFIPISSVLPAYPLELRQKGVRGEVGLKIEVDKGGSVRHVLVTKQLHPYLDNAAVQAVRQWRYEPFLVKGRKVPVSMEFTIRFDPGEWPDDEYKENARATPYPAELARILELGGNYCDLLTNAVLDFTCIETIKETHYYVQPKLFTQVVAIAKGGGKLHYGDKIISYDPRRTERNTYVCDYMLTRTKTKPVEQRLILTKKGRSTNASGPFLKEDRYIAIAPLFASIRVLGKNRQDLFNYHLVGKKKINGIKTSVIEALPKSGNVDGVEYGKLWIDPKDGRILRSEIRGVPLKGFADVLEESTELNVKADFVAIHEYEVEKNNVLFPSRSKINVTYPQRWARYPTRRSPKIKAVISYDQYKFFSVSTSVNIKK
ncbi:MAG: TonB family protein [Candidatus Aminicenantes bacterium]|nr:TonB family protein [Candidatus Aminicenantes bacterium]